MGKPWTAMVRAFLELIAYGLRVLLPLLPPPPGYKAIYWASPSGGAKGPSRGSVRPHGKGEKPSLVPDDLKGHLVNLLQKLGV